MLNKIFTAVLMIMLLTVPIAEAAKKEKNPEQKIPAINSAPDFNLQSLDGKDIKLSNYRGKKVMLNFWATWCPPCKIEMPAMQELYQKADGQFEILAVNIDSDNDVASFMKDNKLTFPVVLDQDHKVSQQYSILSIPTTFVIDEQGNVVKKYIGAMTLEQMQQFMDAK
ncbi:peroxiredoxin family protein [Mesobacillus zeae]|uniref:TlpA family protein disulfide reductase n=1 Tax=Mesobacillus zeae TaxID=1917180 RepID=A0A398BDY9_9BACI|nr:redoxin domain-containing protein [Mesobacillus zeae]RID85796.1 TlpA family protein disulfide reductase [Mesobacillus zeae]